MRCGRHCDQLHEQDDIQATKLARGASVLPGTGSGSPKGVPDAVEAVCQFHTPVFNGLGPAADARFILGKIPTTEMGAMGLGRVALGRTSASRLLAQTCMHGMPLPW